ncbi:EF-hand [Cadophora sp. DSE1049]|nr:EF-hand [Cadophora sp. DSE1049]
MLHMLLYDNGHSKISLEQLENILKRLGFNHTRSEIKTMFNGINHCDEDAIEIDDFVSALDSTVPDEASDTEIARAFEVFDREKSGQITSDRLYSVIDILGQRMNKDQLSAVFKEADLDGDGVINYDDFYRLVKRKERRPT